LRVVAPVVPHLAEEAWHCLPALVPGKENRSLFKTSFGPSPEAWRGRAAIEAVEAVRIAEEVRRAVVASPVVGSSSPRLFRVDVTVGVRETYEKLKVSVRDPEDHSSISIDNRCDNRRFWLSARNCQIPTPTSQNLELEQQIRIFGAD
jgi:valyl-tRNA synthetase